MIEVVETIAELETPTVEIITELGNPTYVGPAGPQGPKPIKGVDYWTAEDKNEIITEATNKVLPQIPTKVSELENDKNYATEAHVADVVANVKPDMSNYYNKAEVDEAIANVDVDLTGYATEAYVNEKIEAIPEADLTNYYTKQETNALIPDTAGFITMPEVEAKGYATEDYVAEQISAISSTDLSNYYTKAEVDEAIPDVSDFATKSEIPSLEDYATEIYVNQQIEAIPTIDLTNYYTKSEVDNEISQIELTPGPAGDSGVYLGNTEPEDETVMVWVDTDGDTTNVATIDVVGLVKPDGQTITITADGTISAIGGGSGTTESDVYVIEDYKNLTDDDVVILDDIYTKLNNNEPINKIIGIKQNTSKQIEFVSTYYISYSVLRIFYNADVNKYGYYDYQYSTKKFINSYFTSLITSANINSYIPQSSNSWTYTNDNYSSDLYGAKEIFIIMRDTNQEFFTGYWMPLYENYQLGDWSNQYFPLSCPNGTAGQNSSYWYYDGSSINFEVSSGSMNECGIYYKT